MPAVVWFILVLSSPSCGPAAGDDDLRVTVLTVVATRHDHYVGPKLAAIAAQARKRDPSLTGFRLERVTSKPVAMGQREVFELVQGATAEVTILAREPKTGRYRLRLQAPGCCGLCYSCCCGKFLPMFVEVKTPDNSRVIVAVMVRPCPPR